MGGDGRICAMSRSCPNQSEVDSGDGSSVEDRNTGPVYNFFAEESEEDSESDNSSSSDSTEELLPAVNLSEEDLNRLTVIPTEIQSEANEDTETKVDNNKSVAPRNTFREEIEEWDKKRKRKPTQKKVKETKKKRTVTKSRWVRVTKQANLEAVNKHKYHLLLWLAHHKFVYDFTKNECIRSIVLSLLPNDLTVQVKTENITSKRKKLSNSLEHERIEILLRWFQSMFQVISNAEIDSRGILSADNFTVHLLERILDVTEATIILLIACELMSITARYVGIADVIGIHVSGSSIENSALDREQSFISEERQRSLETVSPVRCWIEVLSENTWLSVEIQTQSIGDNLIFEHVRLLRNSSTVIQIVTGESEDISPKKKAKKQEKNTSKGSKCTLIQCEHKGCIYYCIAIFKNCFFDVTWRYKRLASCQPKQND